jgi:predicted PurR-regulated permease PerM
VTDDLRRQISRFMLANVFTSVLAGLATWAWTWGFGVPYPILLGSLVAVLDLIPTVGSTIGGAIVSLVSLTVGLPTAIATLIFYVGFRLAEDYLIQPRAMRYSVELPGVITVPAVLVGGALLGIPGALFAVPVALIIRVLYREIAKPALDRR